MKKKKRTRRKKVIKTPKRAPMQSEEEFLLDCVGAAMEQVDDQREKLDNAVDRLCQLRAKLRTTEAACARYVSRLEKCRAAKPNITGGIKGNGELIVDDDGCVDLTVGVGA